MKFWLCIFVFCSSVSCFANELSTWGSLHDCDGWAGISGGPAIKKILVDGKEEIKVVGLTNAHYNYNAEGGGVRPYYSDDYANIGTSASNFIRKLLELRRDYD